MKAVYVYLHVQMWEGIIPEGAVSDQVGMIMDFYPTLCEIIGIPITHEIEGQSIFKTLQGENQDLSERLLLLGSKRRRTTVLR